MPCPGCGRGDDDPHIGTDGIGSMSWEEFQARVGTIMLPEHLAVDLKQQAVETLDRVSSQQAKEYDKIENFTDALSRIRSTSGANIDVNSIWEDQARWSDEQRAIFKEYEDADALIDRKYQDTQYANARVDHWNSGDAQAILRGKSTTIGVELDAFLVDDFQIDEPEISLQFAAKQGWANPIARQFAPPPSEPVAEQPPAAPLATPVMERPAQPSPTEEVRRAETLQELRAMARQAESLGIKVEELDQLTRQADALGVTAEQLHATQQLASELELGVTAEALLGLSESDIARIESVCSSDLTASERMQLGSFLEDMPAAKQQQALTQMTRLHVDMPDSPQRLQLLERVMGTQSAGTAPIHLHDGAGTAEFNPETNRIEVGAGLLDKEPKTQTDLLRRAAFHADGTARLQGSGDGRRDITMQYHDSLMRASADSGLSYTLKDGSWTRDITDRIQYESTVHLIASQSFALPDKYIRRPEEFRRFMAMTQEQRTRTDPKAAAAVQMALAEMESPQAFIARARMLTEEGGPGVFSDTHPQVAEHLARIDATDRAMAGERVSAGFNTDAQVALQFDAQELLREFATSEPVAFSLSEENARLDADQQKAYDAYQDKRLGLIKDFAEGRYDVAARVEHWRDAAHVTELRDSLAAAAQSAKERASVDILKSRLTQIATESAAEPTRAAPTEQPMEPLSDGRLQEMVRNTQSPQRLEGIVRDLARYSGTKAGAAEVASGLARLSGSPEGALQVSVFLSNTAELESGRAALSGALARMAQTEEGSAALVEMLRNVGGSGTGARSLAATVANLTASPEGAAQFGQTLSGLGSNAATLLPVLRRATESAAGNRAVAATVENLMQEPAFRQSLLTAAATPEGLRQLTQMLDSLGPGITSQLVSSVAGEGADGAQFIESLRGAGVPQSLLPSISAPTAAASDAKLPLAPEERLQELMRRAQTPDRIASVARQMAAMGGSTQGGGTVAEALLRQSATSQGAAQVAEFLRAASSTESGAAALQKVLGNLSQGDALAQLMDRLSSSPANARSVVDALAHLTGSAAGIADFERTLGALQSNPQGTQAFMRVLAAGGPSAATLLDNLMSTPPTASALRAMAAQSPQLWAEAVGGLSGTPAEANTAVRLLAQDSPAALLAGFNQNFESAAALAKVLATADAPQAASLLNAINGESALPQWLSAAARSAEGRSALTNLYASSPAALVATLSSSDINRYATSSNDANALVGLLRSAAKIPEGANAVNTLMTEAASSPGSASAITGLLSRSDSFQRITFMGQAGGDLVARTIAMASSGGDGALHAAVLLGDACRTPALLEKLAGNALSTSMANVANSAAAPNLSAGLVEMTRSAEGNRALLSTLRGMDSADSLRMLSGLAANSRSTADLAELLLSAGRTRTGLETYIKILAEGASQSPAQVSELYRNLQANPQTAEATGYLFKRASLIPQLSAQLESVQNVLDSTTEPVAPQAAVSVEEAVRAPFMARTQNEILFSIMGPTAPAASATSKSSVAATAGPTVSVAMHAADSARPAKAAVPMAAWTTAQTQLQFDPRSARSVMAAATRANMPTLAYSGRGDLMETIFGTKTSDLVPAAPGAVTATSLSSIMATAGPALGTAMSLMDSDVTWQQAAAPVETEPVAVPPQEHEAVVAAFAQEQPSIPQTLLTPLATRTQTELLATIMGAAPDTPAIRATPAAVAGASAPLQAAALAAMERIATLETAEQLSSFEAMEEEQPWVETEPMEYREIMRSMDGKPISGAALRLSQDAIEEIGGVGGVFKPERASDEDMAIRKQAAGLYERPPDEEQAPVPVFLQDSQAFPEHGSQQYSMCPSCGTKISGTSFACPQCSAQEGREIAMVSQIKFAAGGFYFTQTSDQVEVTTEAREVFANADEVAILRRPPIFPTLSQVLALKVS